MKPKEFDELIRQKFDRNDFAYNPENWDQLAEKLDGSAKKRSMIMWWWVPLAGMAASVALAFGVSSLLRQAMPGDPGGNIAHIQKGKALHIAQSGSLSYKPEATQNETSGPNIQYSASVNNTHGHTFDRHKHTIFNKPITRKEPGTNVEEQFGINLKNATSTSVVWNAKPIDLLTNRNTKEPKKNKQVVVNDALSTFKPEEKEAVQKVPKLSVILSGGYNHGNQNSGYMAGATIRRMINDKVYVESDMAFATSNNTQSVAYVAGQVPVAAAARQMNNAKTTSAESNKTLLPPVMKDVIGQKDISYNLYYAQVTPGIGYKLIKKMSIGVGPDFQKMLVDNRPAPSTVDRGNIQVAPMFDVGFIGKTEYAVTKKVRAAVYYRKGVNNIITPMDKYIDRDYLQFQVKYTIFNK
ncbi:MAG: hypothetical protein ACHQD8_05930 [Chitinophagales bacterium]